MLTDQRGRREALVVATGSYRDPELSNLATPVQDGLDLDAVLGEPQVGGFRTRLLLDETEREIRIAVNDLLTGRGPGDLVLLYLSCHGLLDQRRRLYFAAADTRGAQVSATGLDASWLSTRLDDCPAQQIVILDCCFSGGFRRGAKGPPGVELQELVTGPARGRVVLTASRSTELAWPAGPHRLDGLLGSAFTSALAEGIRTGAADRDRDGIITVDEAYEYAERRVRAIGSPQTPQRWLLGGEGALVLARRPHWTPPPPPRGAGPGAPDEPPREGEPARDREPARAGEPAQAGEPGREGEPRRPAEIAAPVRRRAAGVPDRRAWIVLAIVVALVFVAWIANTAVALARLG